ncbi:sensor histidine kinase [Actinomadura sp. NAK00032]|uniref:sensor histidine kinase n=1 Tax=Actinomadura sp. NAK00032 TaxID=2742128 RepID=UPI0015923268|nr:sensor histidine kinase [Actinomadura sp. NAK00032]QKW39816.1 sensor histidine kinase [Actinomadura sp. NAK00032]
MDEADFEADQAHLLRRGRLRALDVLLAVVLVAVIVVVAGNMLKDRPDFTLPFLASCLVGVGLGVLVAVRRLWPRRALTAAVALSCVATVAGVLWDPFAAPALVLCTVASVEHPRRSARALGGCVAAVTAAAVLGEVVHSRYGLAVAAGWTAAAWVLLGCGWLVGHLLRRRRWNAACLAEQRGHRILADERLRIARELHDVVTHGMGMIAVKAGVANHIAETRPDEAREALQVIETTSRDALAEMRRLLDMLRHDVPGTDLTQPGIDGLQDLAQQVRAAGVEVELAVSAKHALPEALQLTVYRIVQEALTNVVKHAAPTRCQAAVDVTARQVSIQVADDGTGRPPLKPAPGGHGLVGMRERVAMYGGTFSAGPRAGGGFAVAATLPHGGDR